MVADCPTCGILAVPLTWIQIDLSLLPRKYGRSLLLLEVKLIVSHGKHHSIEEGYCRILECIRLLLINYFFGESTITIRSLEKFSNDSSQQPHIAQVNV